MTAGPWLCRSCGTTWTVDDVAPDEAGWWESPCGHVFGRNEPPPPLPHLSTRSRTRAPRPARTAVPRARTADPDTSHRAADSVDEPGGTHRELLDLFAAFGPMTDEQVADRWEGGPVSPSGLRTRRAELVDAGLVEWSGMERLTASGRRTRAWRLSPDGSTLARSGPARVGDSPA